MSTANVNEPLVALVDKLKGILEKETLTPEDEKALHGLRAENPELFEDALKSPEISTHTDRISTALKAEEARIAAAPAPAAAAAAKAGPATAAEIEGLPAAIANGDREAIAAAIKANPTLAEEIAQEVQKGAPALLQDKGLRTALMEAREVAAGVKAVEEFAKDAAKGDKAAIEKLLHGKGGEEILKHVSDDTKTALSEAGIHAEGLVKAGTELRAATEKATSGLKSAIEEAKGVKAIGARHLEKATPELRAKLEPILRGHGGAEAFAALSKEEQDLVRTVVPHVDDILHGAKVFAEDLTKLGSLIVKKDGVFVIENAEEAAKLVSKHGEKILEQLPEAQRAAAYATPAVHTALEGIEKAVIKAAELATKVGKGGKLTEEAAAEMKTLWASHGSHIMEAQGKNPEFQKTMAATFGSEWPAMQAAASKVEGGAAKESGKWLSKVGRVVKNQFVYSEDLLKEMKAAKAGNNEELAKLAKIEAGSIRWARALPIAAGAAILTAIVAGSGNSGPGEHARSVSQDQGMAQGRA